MRSPERKGTVPSHATSTPEVVGLGGAGGRGRECMPSNRERKACMERGRNQNWPTARRQRP